MLSLGALAHFLGGMVLVNSIPHLVSGVLGRPFQSPFAKPRGKGLSSATVNVFWAFFNLLVAYLLIVQVGTLDLHNPVDALVLGAGMLAMALYLARIFGRLHGGNLVVGENDAG